MEFACTLQFREGKMDENRKELIQFLIANVGVRGKDWAISKPSKWSSQATIRFAKKEGSALVKLAFSDRAYFTERT